MISGFSLVGLPSCTFVSFVDKEQPSPMRKETNPFADMKVFLLTSRMVME
jgi:hypothetical protein